MKKVFYALMLGLAVVACEPAEYDDSALVERMDELEGKVEKIAEDLATLQGSVDAMKTLAQALKDGIYITEYSLVEGTEGDYVIKFSDGEQIIIEKGDQGVQGDQGIQGVQGNSVTVVEKDGELYWKIEGSEDLYPVYKANPVFSSEEGKLYVSFPPAEEKIYVGTLEGKSVFDEVKPNEEEGYVEFTTIPAPGETEGVSFKLPILAAFALEIQTNVGVEAGKVVEIPYTVKGAGANTVVDAFASGAYLAEVVATDAATGVVKVTVPAPFAAGNVLVWAENGEGKTSIRKISFAEESYNVNPVEAKVAVEGGTIEVTGFSNVAFDAKSDQEWLKVVSVKSGEFTITLSADANEGDARSATVSLLRKGTETVLTSFTIEQEGVTAAPALASLVWSTAVPFGGGKDRNMTTDGEYVYVAQAAGGDGVIKAYSIADGSYVQDVQFTLPAGVLTSTHTISCVRMLPNTDESVNGGKPVLVASSLSVATDGASLTFYVWKNGINEEPAFYKSLDTGARRLGDKFTVKGTYQAGELWMRDYNSGANAAIRIAVNNGEVTSWGGYAAGRFNIPLGETQESIGEVYAHPDATFDGSGNPDALFVTSNTVSAFFTPASPDTPNTFAKSEWTTDPELSQTYGYNFFEHNGKDYIAYVKVNADRAGGSLNIIEDVNGAADFKATLEAKTNIETYPVSGTGNAGHGLGDCSVAQVNGTTYIAVMIQNIGLEVYKLN